MSTTVQTTYRPQLSYGYAGMIADEVESSVQSFVCETVAGIPFGVAVSQGSRDKGCALGGTHFLGLSQRDVTLSLSPIDPQAAYGTQGTVDLYSQYTNVSVMSRGHMWVVAGADVVANDPVYFNSTTGQLTNSASGIAATASILFTSQPVTGTTVTVNGGAPITFVDTITSGIQCLRGATLGDTIANLANALNAVTTQTDSNIFLMEYAAYPPSPMGLPQGSGANQLNISAKAVGVAGNSYTLATTAAGATVTAFAGGLGGTNTVIANARWATTAMAGALAKVALANQT